jgi:DNA-binding Lrp family transcriptional regulator
VGGFSGMNSKDLKIIAFLRKNARISLTRLSRRINVPVSTIFDRLKFNECGVIKKHTCLLDFAVLGFHTRANIVFRVDRDDKDGLKEHLLKCSCVNSFCRVNNGFDFMVEGVFRQINDLEEFLDNIESKFKILDKKTFFIIEDLKKEEFMSDPDLMFNPEN